ncbi:hypothetical protein KN10_2435 [Anoxybacillus flavithermus NBRC 109594]|uniref:Uncharacterized protein n=1 Tax=Anoxybacillus flavithermus NBRC 109594 TaxID=1315967 RepID=R4G200_9BACL|nr:hypothetical protein KN10_2435 [Anoxybacillus flavithermus NBRC 109594]
MIFDVEKSVFLFVNDFAFCFPLNAVSSFLFSSQLFLQYMLKSFQ